MKHRSSNSSSCDIRRADEMTRRHFMDVAARSMLGVRVMPYLGGLAALLSRAHGSTAAPAPPRAMSFIFSCPAA